MMRLLAGGRFSTMKSRRFTLDTNIVIALMAKNETALARAREALLSGSVVSINAVSYYEIRRGLESTERAEKLAAFDRVCSGIGLLLIDEKAILDEASRIWDGLRQRGVLIEDADILMASIAITKGYVLVSDDNHFERVPGLVVENWLR